MVNLSATNAQHCSDKRGLFLHSVQLAPDTVHNAEGVHSDLHSVSLMDAEEHSKQNYCTVQQPGPAPIKPTACLPVAVHACMAQVISSR